MNSMQKMIEERFRMVGDLFSKEGDDLRQAILRLRGGYFGPWDELRERLNITDNKLLGRTWYRFQPKGEATHGITKCVIYLHGGGWVLETGPQQLDFAAWIVEHSGVEVWFPEYPLAPEADCLDARRMVTELYELALREFSASEVCLMGDSAGGGMALSAAMDFRDRGMALPNGLVLISPGVDLLVERTEAERAYDKVLANGGLNCIRSNAQATIQEWWRGPLEETNYLVNPLFGDLRGLPPMTIFAGSAENVAIMKLVTKAASQRVPVKYWERLNAPHTWVTRADQDNSEERALILDLLRRPADLVE